MVRELLGLVFVACSAVAAAPVSPGLSDRVQVIGAFSVAYGPHTLRVWSTQRPERPLWVRHQDDAGWLTTGTASLAAADRQGSFTFTPAFASACVPEATGLTASFDGASLRLQWPLVGSPACLDKHVTMAMQAVSDKRLAFTVEADDTTFNYVFLAAASTADESFHGFGLQPTYLDLKGQLVPIWTQEQGIARGQWPLTDLINAASPGSAGSAVTSYMTAPHYLTNHGSSLFLKNTEYAEVDLRDPRRAQLSLFAHRMSGEFLAGATPLEQVSVFTESSGRMKALPDWVHRGAIVGMQGGTEVVRKVWAKLQAMGTPLAAFWLQDWEGKRATAIGSQLWWNWELDEQRYPGWSELVADLQERGLRVMGYINPHLVDVAKQGKSGVKRNLYAEAAAAGYLLKNAQGQPYPVQLTAFATGMLDLSHPAGRTWIKQVIKDNLLGAGLSGWMCDFSEAMPVDAVVASGQPGLAYHNQYAVEWVRLNREAVQEAHRDDDVVFFARAGYTTSPGYARLFWQGDQTVSWDQFDGLKSAVNGLMAGGLSGYSINHSDIGGYFTLAVGPFGLRRSRELLERWLEYSAFTPVFRTHEGNQPEANAQFYSDDGTYRDFDRNARLFASLFFYRKQLFQEAETLGYPVVRPLFLHYPDDQNAYHISDEFLLGRDLLVAPVVEAGATSRTVYLPQGRWVHVWSGQIYGDDGHGVIEVVAAPLGQPPAFYQAGSAFGEQWLEQLRRGALR